MKQRQALETSRFSLLPSDAPVDGETSQEGNAATVVMEQVAAQPDDLTEMVSQVFL